MMSCINCSYCGRLVDTDLDADGIFELNNDYTCSKCFGERGVDDGEYAQHEDYKKTVASFGRYMSEYELVLVLSKMAKEISVLRFNKEPKMAMPDGYWEEQSEKRKRGVIEEYTTPQNKRKYDETNKQK